MARAKETGNVPIAKELVVGLFTTLRTKGWSTEKVGVLNLTDTLKGHVLGAMEMDYAMYVEEKES